MCIYLTSRANWISPRPSRRRFTVAVVDDVTTQTETALVWMTCVRDGREHAVLELDVAVGTSAGFYRAVCGHLVMPRAVASPCGARCSACLADLGLRVPIVTESRRARWRARLRILIKVHRTPETTAVR
jgi:hypothetical protein